MPDDQPPEAFGQTASGRTWMSAERQSISTIVRDGWLQQYWLTANVRTDRLFAYLTSASGEDRLPVGSTWPWLRVQGLDVEIALDRYGVQKVTVDGVPLAETALVFGRIAQDNSHFGPALATFERAFSTRLIFSRGDPTRVLGRDGILNMRDRIRVDASNPNWTRPKTIQLILYPCSRAGVRVNMYVTCHDLDEITTTLPSVLEAEILGNGIVQDSSVEYSPLYFSLK